jgi:hypothetical protein
MSLLADEPEMWGVERKTLFRIRPGDFAKVSGSANIVEDGRDERLSRYLGRQIWRPSR